MLKKFYRTAYIYEVLSEEPLPDCLSLQQIADITDLGECVGRFGETKQTALTPEQTVAALYDFGSEPGFFNLDEGGNPLDEDNTL